MKRARNAVVAAALLLSACGGMQNANVGAITGAVVGGLAGGWAGAQFGGGTGQTVFTVLGVAGGAMAGYDLGRQISMADRPDYNRAVANAVDGPSGQSNWQNVSTGNGGLIRVDQAFLNGNGEHCKTYRSTVAFPDEIVNGAGTACQSPQGEWVLVADAFH